MLHIVFLTLHAGAGALALGLGVPALRSRRRFGAFFAALVVMTVFMVAAVLQAWPDLDTTTRAVFCGLGTLAAAVLLRADAARRLLRDGRGPGDRAYVGHLGFVLISLFDAFVVVAVLDLGGPGWLAVGLAVAGAVGGHLALRRVPVSAPAAAPAPA